MTRSGGVGEADTWRGRFRYGRDGQRQLSEGTAGGQGVVRVRHSARQEGELAEGFHQAQGQGSFCAWGQLHS